MGSLVIQISYNLHHKRKADLVEMQKIKKVHRVEGGYAFWKPRNQKAIRIFLKITDLEIVRDV